jgi:predicted glycosyltransferase
MRIWIDITNSPHVLFFEPVIADLRADGHTVEVTARDYAQAVPLLRAKKIEFTLIGKHQGKSRVRKAYGLASRSLALVRWARPRKFDIAVGHNSNDLAVAARMLGIPHLVIHDYEHADVSYAVNARLAQRILVPDAIPTSAITAHGAKPEEVRHFPGLKEHVYLSAGDAREDLREQLGAGPETVLAVVRPPATMSAYHLGVANDLFALTLARLGDRPDVRIVVLPRTPEQAASLAATLPANAVIPEQVLDGPSLITSADLVFSAGGTMNREAVALGTPAYTVFAGKLGAVDRDLIDRGLMVQVTAPEDVVLRRKEPAEGWHVVNRPVIIAEVYDLAASARANKARGSAADGSLSGTPHDDDPPKGT